MNLDSLFAHELTPRYWALLLLIVWGAVLVFFNLVNFTPYGMDRRRDSRPVAGLVIADQVAHPVVVFRHAGLPRY